MALELNPTLEIRLRSHAAQRGLTLEQLLERSLPQHESSVPEPASDEPTRVRALIAEWQQQDRTPVFSPALEQRELTQTEALFKQWEAEDSVLTQDEITADLEFWQEFQQSREAERILSSTRTTG